VNSVDVLVLHGSPGAGKSTQAQAISERLREAGTAHAIIDLDDLSLIFPSPGRWFAQENLRAVWPNYAAVPRLKVIVVTVLADEGELTSLRAAAPSSTLVVCELTAPLAVLKDRVTAREPNEFWRSQLEYFVNLFHGRDDLARIRDFEVSTHDKTLADTAREVLTKAGW
jgi:hypothetical protein